MRDFIFKSLPSAGNNSSIHLEEYKEALPFLTHFFTAGLRDDLRAIVNLNDTVLRCLRFFLFLAGWWWWCVEFVVFFFLCLVGWFWLGFAPPLSALTLLSVALFLSLFSPTSLSQLLHSDFTLS